MDQGTVALVLEGILAAHGLAIFVVNVTDTPVDNTWVKRFYTVVEKVAGIFNVKKVKQA